MSKIRINDLARELEVKSKAILDALTEVGVTEKKTHSSSIEEHEAEKVRALLRGSGEGSATSKSSRASRPEPDGIKTKIDLSHISKPGDVLKAIIGKQQAGAPAPPAPPVSRPAPPAPEVKVPVAPIAKPAAPASAPPAISAPPRIVMPSPPGSRPAAPVPSPASAVPPRAVVPSSAAPPASAPPAAHTT